MGKNKKTKNYRDNQKLLYDTLKQLRKQEENNMVNIRDKNDNTITEEDKIIESWKEHFEEITCDEIKDRKA